MKFAKYNCQFFIVMLLSTQFACSINNNLSHASYDCNKTIGFEKLESGILNGERNALLEFVTCREKYEGGNLGDLYRAAGVFSTSSPDMYLEILDQQSISPNEMPNFLIMLPLSTVDNTDSKKAELRKRIERISTAKPSKIKNIALDILESRLKSLDAE